MHRLLVIRMDRNAPDKFRVIADSRNASISEERSISIEEAGGSAWAEFDDSTGYSSPYATLPCRGTVSSLGYWYVNKTGKDLEYDFAQARLSERKVITSGELHVEYEGREYVARTTDSIIFLLDPNDRTGEALTPFPVRFLGDHECTVVYTEYAVS